MWLWLSMALAGTEYYGLPVEGIEGFGRPMFQSTATGWHVQVEDGIIRVFIAPDEEAAQAWMEKMLERLARFDPQPYPPEDEPLSTLPPTEPQPAPQDDPTAPPPSDATDIPSVQDRAAVLPPIVFEEAYGEPVSLLMFRDGNLCVLVHTNANAMYWAQITQNAAVLEPTPPPDPPTLRRDNLGWWHLEAPDAVHVSYVGGTLVPDAGLTFSQPPRAGIAWGPLGRAVRVDFRDDGTPAHD